MSIDIRSLLVAVWHRAREHPVVVLLFVLRHVIILGSALFAVLWVSFVQGKEISKDLGTDFLAVEAGQRVLLEEIVEFERSLLDPNQRVDLVAEMDQIRSSAQETLLSLGRLRAPTSRIEAARLEYRDALTSLIGFTNRLERDGVDGMGVHLYRVAQATSNAAGELRRAVEGFQGGAWPQVKGALF